MVYRIYSNLEGIPSPLVSEIFRCTDTFQLIDQPDEADFFAYPTHFQIAYDYSSTDFIQHGVDGDIQSFIQQRFAALEALAAQYRKKIITVYIRDNAKPLPSENEIVFRTSLTAAGRQPNEFAFPANGRPLQVTTTIYPEFVPWQDKPAVGFRGQAAPLQLPWNEAWRNSFNMLAQKFRWQKKFPIQYNFGYLHRRNALIYLQRDPNIELDYSITSVADIFNMQSRVAYADNLLNYPYSLCVSGHGNYSFRLYETMAAGRIPLFVNTDCVLPLEELIDYKTLFVWTEANEIQNITRKLIGYHNQFKGALLIKQQSTIKKIWQEYFSENNYYRHLPFYLKYFL